jgi:chromodomain-containing protein
MQKIRNMAYRLELPPSIKVHDMFHINLLTPYKEMEEYRQAYTRPPLITVQSEEEYEVESILQAQQKGVGDSLKYKVHWKGYPSANDSWVPHKDLHSPDLLKEFYAQGGKIQAVKRRRERLQKLISSLSCLPPATAQATPPLRTSSLLLTTMRDLSQPLYQTRPLSNKYNKWQYTLPTSYEPSRCSILAMRQTTAIKNEKEEGSSYASQCKSSATTTKQEMPPRTSWTHPLKQSTAMSSLQDRTIRPCRPLEEPSSTVSYKSLATTSTCTPSTTLRTAL